MLIIDDDENTLEPLTSMIEQEDFEVIRAHGGKEGIDKHFSESQPDNPDPRPYDAESQRIRFNFKLRMNARTKDIPLIVCTSGDFTGKDIDELNGELKEHLVS